MSKARALRAAMAGPGPVLVAGVHDGLGARLAEEAGFGALWASGLGISAAAAVPDASILSMADFLAAAIGIDRATDLPVVADCDGGFGGVHHVLQLVTSYAAAGIAAVCLEDKPFPKRNSFAEGSAALVPVAGFCAKLAAAVAARERGELLIIARTEALVAGHGLPAALHRAEAYRQAGADALLIHSKASEPDEIFRFLEAWERRAPVVVVPTTYPGVSPVRLAKAGANVVIYANQGLRASIAAAETTYREIIAHAGRGEGLAAVEPRLAPVERVFELQHQEAFDDQRRGHPVDVSFGRGCVAGLLDDLPRPVLLVTGSGTLARAGLERLADADGVCVHAGIRPNPSPAAVDAATDRARAIGARAVIGLGGGSVLDVAKAVAVCLSHGADVATVLARLAAGDERPRQVALLAVPTTAGTGSEVTRWASLWEDGHKLSLDTSAGYADRALIDPDLSASMGPLLTASTGLDALGHALESLWSVHATPVSDLHARTALVLAREHLLPAVAGSRPSSSACDHGALSARAAAQRAGQASSDLAATRELAGHREGMARAALEAGLALSRTATAAAHALSYELTGRHGLPHGLAVGLTCSALFALHARRSPARTALALEALAVPDVASARTFLGDVFRAAGAEPSLSHFGVPPSAWPDVVTTALASNRLANDGSHPAAQDLLSLMETIK